jgi:hypothetical protein
MALTGTKAEPVRSAKRFGYAIKMMSGDQIVPVIVTDEVLQDIVSPPNAGPERLGQYRRQIEEIASRKHSTGQIEADGSICVTSADI